MANHKEIFLKKSEIAFDLKHRKTIKHNISKYDEAVVIGKTRYTNIDLAKKRASYIKETTINDLGNYLVEFEKNSTSNGASVLWARDAKEAISHVKNILLENNVHIWKRYRHHSIAFVFGKSNSSNISN